MIGFTFCLSYRNSYPLKLTIKENIFAKARLKYIKYLNTEYNIVPQDNLIKWINQKQYAALLNEDNN